MPRRESTPAGRARQEHDADAPLFIEKADGRRVSVNWPLPGQVTVTHPDGRVEQVALEAFLAAQGVSDGR